MDPLKLRKVGKTKSRQEFRQMCFDMMTDSILDELSGVKHRNTTTEVCLKPLIPKSVYPKGENIYIYRDIRSFIRQNTKMMSHFNGHIRFITKIVDRYDHLTHFPKYQREYLLRFLQRTAEKNSLKVSQRLFNILIME